ncbi:MFS transporter [Alkalihalobacillus deserti]|uniref:MFS transporter n=1 Tax=Alkalihalobacillus deserti TaxID=2879466 RepID=UPI00223CE3F2|nr:MFS transporter [Alkalihalobacillus deserti]
MNKRWIVILVSLAAFFGPFTQTIYVPLIPEVQQHFGSSEFVVNLTISIFTLVLALMQVLYGPLVDRFGRKKLLLPGIFIYIVGSFGAALSASIWMLLFFRAIQAAGIAVGSVVATTVIGDLFEGKALGRSMGTFQMFVSLGPVLGPIIGGLIGGYTTFEGVFWILTFFGIILALLNMYFLPETKIGQGDIGRFSLRDFGIVLNNRVGMVVVVLGFIQYYTFYQFLVFMPNLLKETYLLTTIQIGWVFLPLSLTVVIGNLVGGRLQEYVLPKKLIVTCASLGILAILLYIFLAPVSLFLLNISLALFGLCMGVCSPIQTTLLTNTFIEKRATAIGVYNFLRYLGMAAGPMIGTFLFNWKPFAEFYFSAFLFSCVLLFARQKLKDPHITIQEETKDVYSEG